MSEGVRSTTLKERCPTCGAVTPHAVTIEIREERPTGENREYSREPYRVTECLSCGAGTASRVRSA